MSKITKETTDLELYYDVKNVLEYARLKAYAAVNSAMVEAYWDIGRLIFEKQGGTERAAYGNNLISTLSKQLTEEYGRGFTVSNLRSMRQFYTTFPILQSLPVELSWSHFRLILKVENEAARQFYTDECVKSNWSVRQLSRQINSHFYDRLLSSRAPDAKEVLAAEINSKTDGTSPLDFIKDPFILEFLGQNHSEHLFEKDMEKSLIEHIQKLLLELGRGFTFEARQKRISLDGDHFYIDLVFYNYILRCFVLIDLKTGKLTHQDIGQMQMYVNYYTREMMNEGDSKPIGILVCADKNEAVVRYTLPEDNSQIFASKYKRCLPTEDELRIEIERGQRFISEQSGTDE